MGFLESLFGFVIGLLVLAGVGWIGYQLGSRTCNKQLKNCVMNTASSNGLPAPVWGSTSDSNISHAWQNIEDWMKNLFAQMSQMRQMPQMSQPPQPRH